MRSLSSLAVGTDAVIESIDGDTRFISRVTSIGITPGSKVKVIKNDKNRKMTRTGLF